MDNVVTYVCAKLATIVSEMKKPQWLENLITTRTTTTKLEQEKNNVRGHWGPVSGSSKTVIRLPAVTVTIYRSAMQKSLVDDIFKPATCSPVVNLFVAAVSFRLITPVNKEVGPSAI